MKISLMALILGFILDLLIGDPHGLYHPIRLVGNLIGFLEKRLNYRAMKQAGGGEPDPRLVKMDKWSGTLMAVIVMLAAVEVPLFLIWISGMIHPYVRLAVESIMCWQLLATKSLKDESMKVYRKLKKHDLFGSRKAVSMIVGRDTDVLDETGVTKAAVETVAENTSDGVIAPMFYMAIGGPVLGWLYKSINTMDSMVGYKNDRYLYFGRFAAKLDDVVNFIPARISAYVMILGCVFTKLDRKKAAEIYKRDRFNHASPNSAQTEAVMAGALNVQLAGDAWYFGELHKKKTIGDDIRPVKPEDIRRANQLMYATAILSLVIFALIKFIVVLIAG